MLPWSLKLLRSQTKLMAKDAKNMSRYLSLYFLPAITYTVLQLFCSVHLSLVLRPYVA